MTGARKETVVGGLMIVLGSLFLAYASSGGVDHSHNDKSGYQVTALFSRTDGLSVGGSVRLGGVPVGTVVGQTLADDFRALVTLKIRADIKIPKDTAALIQSDGLLGSKYIELQPGGAEEMIGPDERIAYTQGSVIVDDLLARILSQAKARRAQAIESTAAPGPESEIGPKGKIGPEGETDPSAGVGGVEHE